MGHDAWTTTRLLEMSRELEDSQLDREFDVGHRTLRATFEHMVFSMEVCGRGNGRPVDGPVGGRPFACRIG